MKFQLITTCLCLFISQHQLSSQALKLYPLFQEFHSTINPGMLGTEHFDYGTNHRIDIGHHQQKIAEIPAVQTSVLNYTGILTSIGSTRFFAGANVLLEEVAPTRLWKYEGKIGVAFGGYGFRELLSFGISFGQYQFSIETSDALVVDTDDNAIGSGISQSSGPDLGVGLFYLRRITEGVFQEDQYYFGLSLSQIFTPDFSSSIESGRSISRFQGGNYFITAGFNKFLDDGLSFHPLVWIINRVGKGRRVTEIMGKVGMQYKPVSLAIGYGHNNALIFELEFGLNTGTMPIRLGLNWSNNLLGSTNMNGTAETGALRGSLIVPWGGNQ